MEPFDYLAYKKNKDKNTKIRKYTEEEKRLACLIWIGTFFVVFVTVIIIVASKTGKIDIEYGRLGKNPSVEVEVVDEDDGEIVTRKEKFTVDKRLFLIQQEEKGPSKSKAVEKTNEQSEVISNEEFNEIQASNSQYLNKKEDKKEDKKEEDKKSSSAEKTQTPKAQPASQKASLKGKLPVSEKNEKQVTIKPESALQAPKITSKVLVGKYYSIEDARKAQSSFGAEQALIKKINNYYTVQVGVFENYNVAKSLAVKLKAQGYDSWIFQ